MISNWWLFGKFTSSIHPSKYISGSIVKRGANEYLLWLPLRLLWLFELLMINQDFKEIINPSHIHLNLYIQLVMFIIIRSWHSLNSLSSLDPNHTHNHKKQRNKRNVNNKIISSTYSVHTYFMAFPALSLAMFLLFLSSFFCYFFHHFLCLTTQQAFLKI